MKTKLPIWLLGAILIALSGQRAFACGVNPVAVLTITPTAHDSYLNRWYSPVGDVLFTGDVSWDPDGGDPNLASTNYIKLFEWNFGDGYSYSESPSGCGDGQFDGITTHTYTAPGIYTITFKVTDNDDAEESPPDKWNTTGCTIAVVSVGLGVEGVPENMKVIPGAFISYNNDDDNDEGTADKDETAVTGEDNLLKITLSVSPALGYYDGMVRLSIPYGQRELRIWQYPDKGNLVLHGDEGMYYKDWSPPAVPPNLYVEGYLSGTSTLWLSHMKDELTIHDDTVKFRCVELEVSSDASAPLDDWPKTATEIRSPKYIFGKEDPIYVQATNLGIDPGLAETKNNLVKVTSQSGGVARLTLKETDLQSWYFNNVAASGELLYLSDANSEADGDTIKLVDEEKLTFWMNIQPGSDNYVSCYRVMVDKAEVGVEWQSNYGTYDTYPTLNYSDECAEGFYNNLGTANLAWFKNLDSGDLASKESHWDSAGDSSYADSVDFAFWCGHGTTVSETPRALRFFVDLVGGAKQSPDKLLWSEIDWGDKDLDWVVLNTCRFLDGTDDQLKQMVSDTRGVHLICAYVTDMTVYNVAGQYFADRLDEGMSIKNAWHDQCAQYQGSGKTSRVFGATGCMNDSIGANGPIQTSRNPTGSSVYTHDDYTSP